MVAALASVPAGWAQQGSGVPSAASVPAFAAPGMASTPPRLVLEGGGVLRLEASGQTLVLTAADSPHPLRTWSLLEPRQGASLTRLADGRVLLWGGAGKDGALRKTGVLLDPQQDGWVPTALDGVQPRAGHSATLLSDGRLLVAGGKGAPAQAQLWDPRTQQVTEIAMPARVGQTATLQADGKVRLSGGTDGRGQPASQDLVFDPATGTFASAGPVGAAFGTSLAVAAASPKDQDAGVDPATRIALRFTRPVRGSEVNGSTVALMGPAGAVEARVTTAEGGRLVFVQPEVLLFPGTDYTVLVDGLHGLDGAALPLSVIEWKTAASAATPTVQAPGVAARPSATLLGCGQSHPLPCRAHALLADGTWRPGQDNTDARWRAPGAQPAQPALSALEAVAMASQRTSVSGQVLLVDGQPIAGVAVSVGTQLTHTDPSGRFVLSGLPVGHQELYVDGSAANAAGREYGEFVVGVELQAGQLTRLPYTMYLPRISARDTTAIASPLKQDVVLTHPDMPGLQIHIPAGTVIRDRKGALVHHLSIVPTPVNRAPFPVASNYPMYFTLEPGGATVQALTPQAAQGIKILYPNYDTLATGTRANFWIYDPSEGWRVYGQGRVTSDGTRIAPEGGVALYKTMGASYSIDSSKPPPDPDTPHCSDGCGKEAGGGGATAGDPIDLYTGEFSYTETDAVVPGLSPLVVTRSYRPGDPNKQDFGIGTAANFRYTLYAPPTNLQHGCPGGGQCSTTVDYNQLQLVLPGGMPVTFARVYGSGPGGQWQQTGSVSGYAGATITQGSPRGHGYLLTLRDGSMMYFYNYAPNQLMWTIDRFGNRVDYTYDAGLLSHIVSATGRALSIGYDSNNRINTLSDSLGNTWSYAYNDDGYLSQVTRPDGSTRSYHYKIRQAAGIREGADTLPYQARLESITDSKQQRVVFNEFESANGTWTGRVVKQTQADGGVLTINYAHVDGSTTGVLVTKPDGSQRRVVFDPVSHYPSSDTLAYGTPLAQTITYERTASGQTTARTDALGRRTEYAYDSAGRPLQITQLAGTAQARTTTLAYNGDGDLASITDALGRTTSFGYTNRCLTSVTTPLGQTSTATCNGVGQRLSVTDPLGHTTNFTWSNDDLTAITDALGRQTQLRYDALGRLIGVQDAQGNVSRFEYDALGRQTKAVDPLGNSVATGFDGNGNVSAILLPHGAGVTYAYDARDRRISRTDALGQAESWTYDSMDRVATHTDRRNRTTTYSYDALGRPSTATLPGAGGTLTASYDAGNRLMVLSDSLSGTLNWSYDGFDQVTQANGPQGSIVYGYDAVGRRTSMQAATQTKVNYAYDDGDRLTGIAQGTDTVSFAYDNANRLSSKTLPNQVQTVYVYNDANQVTGLAWGKTGQAALGSLGYGYDSRGQLVAQTGSHAPQALPPASTNNTFDDNNRQTQANGNARSYDADGHLLSDGTRTYTWDDRDHLSQITQGGTVIASYSYDALGRRSAKTESGATTQYLYDGLNTVQEMQGTTINPILTGPGIDERYARDDNGGRTYFLTDLLGSTRLLTDTNGNAVQRYDYDPYGTTTQSSTSYNNPYQYTGREHDQSGLYYYRARYYMPELGRFISEDPIKLAGGVNGYAYVGENPISYFDPIGLQSYTPGKMPPSNIPGGPWTPDPSRPPGNFLGPPNGANRQMCSYVPDAKNGGPASATNGAYWKEKVSGEKGWFRYNLDGVPITPEMAHPGAQSTPDWLDIMRISSAWGVVTFFATYSVPLGESEQQIIDSRNENSGSP
ncbi:putative rhs family protein [Xanthomonas albilineans]|nr:putative rhs family protein [Xanthomonas albilineans]